MRKNTARHWLHAGLDLLPLILIPVFMIYSHRHTIDSGSIEVPVNKVVDFNQLAKGNDVSVLGGKITYDNYHFVVDTGDSILGTNVSGQLFTTNLVSQHKYLIKSQIIDTDVNIQLFYNSYSVATNGDYIITSTNNELMSFDYFVFSYTNGYYSIPVQVFDLTQMFGTGDEPTIEQFNQWYSDVYYEYTLSHKELFKNYSTQTYDDTDIMSQFTYQLYNSVDKYFNMGNVFNLGGVYDWFNLNIFSGNAPIALYIVWNIVLYEFVMDLLFLLYALFMWFIDVTKRLIEKPLDSIK